VIIYPFLTPSSEKPIINTIFGCLIIAKFFKLSQKSNNPPFSFSGNLCKTTGLPSQIALNLKEFVDLWDFPKDFTIFSSEKGMRFLRVMPSVPKNSSSPLESFYWKKTAFLKEIYDIFNLEELLLFNFLFEKPLLFCDNSFLKSF